MTVSLSIKEVPAPLAKALRERAAANHRSLQGELMHILYEAVGTPKPFKAKELLAELRKLNFSTPGESTKWIRDERDRRAGTRRRRRSS